MGVPPSRVVQGKCGEVSSAAAGGGARDIGDPLKYFSIIQGNAIRGNNDVSVSNTYSSSDCARACLDRASTLPCRSFDYSKRLAGPHVCVLSRAVPTSGSTQIIAVPGWDLYLLHPDRLAAAGNTGVSLAGGGGGGAPGGAVQAKAPLGPKGYQCGCLNAFYPVCYNGYTFQNPCEAACNGIVEGYSTGRCYQVGKTLQLPPKCVCPLSFAPVCSLSITFPNECQALCLGFGAYKQGQCGFVTSPAAAAAAAPENQPAGIPPGACFCAQRDNRVCGSNNVTYLNLCDAHCKEVEVASKVACDASAGTKVNDCNCPSAQQPVCANGLTLDSACLSNCFGFATYTFGACVTNTRVSALPASSSSPLTSYNAFIQGAGAGAGAGAGGDNGVSISPDNPACNCPRIYQPVCDSANSVSFNNACQAQCQGHNQLLAGVCGSLASTPRSIVLPAAAATAAAAA
eukprot:CAMPEP_0175133878 /NCGR_PEP_ID=MMETSP0087-20121206/7879_1 /TAXON_ID=136419 /ORGANISM="Unknown Unknown, Strain D1" /LENGTH=456 /DNA_ID=CAMNT_0016416401 /DNA_START=1029 /DNA_END=2395 /DNA_ORIENTATION=-